MSSNKKYYWLKLEAKFFDDLRIKKLRNISGGDTFTIIYLKLMLLSLKNDGYIEFEGVFDSVEDEIAEKIQEKVENVKATLIFAHNMQMLAINEDKDLYLSQVQNLTGSETASTIRSRKSRANKKEMLHGNTTAAICNTEKEKELEEKEKWDDFNLKLLNSQISKDKKIDRYETLASQNEEIDF